MTYNVWNKQVKTDDVPKGERIDPLKIAEQKAIINSLYRQINELEGQIFSLKEQATHKEALAKESKSYDALNPRIEENYRKIKELDDKVRGLGGLVKQLAVAKRDYARLTEHRDKITDAQARVDAYERSKGTGKSLPPGYATTEYVKPKPIKVEEMFGTNKPMIDISQTESRINQELAEIVKTRNLLTEAVNNIKPISEGKLLENRPKLVETALVNVNRETKAIPLSVVNHIKALGLQQFENEQAIDNAIVNTLRENRRKIEILNSGRETRFIKAALEGSGGERQLPQGAAFGEFEKMYRQVRGTEPRYSIVEPTIGKDVPHQDLDQVMRMFNELGVGEEFARTRSMAMFDVGVMEWRKQRQARFKNYLTEAKGNVEYANSMVLAEEMLLDRFRRMLVTRDSPLAIQRKGGLSALEWGLLSTSSKALLPMQPSDYLSSMSASPGTVPRVTGGLERLRKAGLVDRITTIMGLTNETAMYGPNVLLDTVLKNSLSLWGLTKSGQQYLGESTNVPGWGSLGLAGPEYRGSLDPRNAPVWFGLKRGEKLSLPDPNMRIMGANLVNITKRGEEFRKAILSSMGAYTSIKQGIGSEKDLKDTLISPAFIDMMLSRTPVIENFQFGPALSENVTSAMQSAGLVNPKDTYRDYRGAPILKRIRGASDEEVNAVLERMKAGEPVDQALLTNVMHPMSLIEILNARSNKQIAMWQTQIPESDLTAIVATVYKKMRLPNPKSTSFYLDTMFGFYKDITKGKPTFSQGAASTHLETILDMLRMNEKYTKQYPEVWEGNTMVGGFNALGEEQVNSLMGMAQMFSKSAFPALYGQQGWMGWTPEQEGEQRRQFEKMLEIYDISRGIGEFFRKREALADKGDYLRQAALAVPEFKEKQMTRLGWMTLTGTKGLSIDKANEYTQLMEWMNKSTIALPERLDIVGGKYRRDVAALPDVPEDQIRRGRGGKSEADKMLDRINASATKDFGFSLPRGFSSDEGWSIEPPFGKQLGPNNRAMWRRVAELSSEKLKLNELIGEYGGHDIEDLLSYNLGISGAWLGIERAIQESVGMEQAEGVLEDIVRKIGAIRVRVDKAKIYTPKYMIEVPNPNYGRRGHPDERRKSFMKPRPVENYVRIDRDKTIFIKNLQADLQKMKETSPSIYASIVDSYLKVKAEYARKGVKLRRSIETAQYLSGSSARDVLKGSEEDWIRAGQKITTSSEGGWSIDYLKQLAEEQNITLETLVEVMGYDLSTGKYKDEGVVETGDIYAELPESEIREKIEEGFDISLPTTSTGRRIPGLAPNSPALIQPFMMGRGTIAEDIQQAKNDLNKMKNSQYFRQSKELSRVKRRRGKELLQAISRNKDKGWFTAADIQNRMDPAMWGGIIPLMYRAAAALTRIINKVKGGEEYFWDIDNNINKNVFDFDVGEKEFNQVLSKHFGLKEDMSNYMPALEAFKEFNVVNPILKGYTKDIQNVITARGEKYRGATEKDLLSYGVNAKELIMMDISKFDPAQSAKAKADWLNARAERTGKRISYVDDSPIVRRLMQKSISDKVRLMTTEDYVEEHGPGGEKVDIKKMMTDSGMFNPLDLFGRGQPIRESTESVVNRLIYQNLPTLSGGGREYTPQVGAQRPVGSAANVVDAMKEDIENIFVGANKREMDIDAAQEEAYKRVAEDIGLEFEEQAGAATGRKSYKVYGARKAKPSGLFGKLRGMVGGRATRLTNLPNEIISVGSAKFETKGGVSSKEIAANVATELMKKFPESDIALEPTTYGQETILRATWAERKTGTPEQQKRQEQFKNVFGYTAQSAGGLKIGILENERYNKSLDATAESMETLRAKGGRLGALSWTFASISMASMGVYFSIRSILGVLQQGFEAIWNPLKNVEGILQAYGWLQQFGGEGQGILDRFGLSTKDIVDQWKNMTTLTSKITLALAGLGAKVLKDNWEDISSIVDKVVKWLSDPNIAKMFGDVIKAVNDNMGEILNTATWLLGTFRMIAPYIPLLLTITAITMIVQPISSLVSMMANISKTAMLFAKYSWEVVLANRLTSVEMQTQGIRLNEMARLMLWIKGLSTTGKIGVGVAAVAGTGALLASTNNFQGLPSIENAQKWGGNVVKMLANSPLGIGGASAAEGETGGWTDKVVNKGYQTVGVKSEGINKTAARTGVGIRYGDISGLGEGTYSYSNGMIIPTGDTKFPEASELPGGYWNQGIDPMYYAMLALGLGGPLLNVMRGRTSGTTVPTKVDDWFRVKPSAKQSVGRVARSAGGRAALSAGEDAGILARVGLGKVVGKGAGKGGALLAGAMVAGDIGLRMTVGKESWQEAVGGTAADTITGMADPLGILSAIIPEEYSPMYSRRGGLHSQIAEGVTGLLSSGNKEPSPYNAMISGVGKVAAINAEHKSISAQANSYLADIAASIKKGSAMVVSGGGYSVPGSVGYLAAGEEGEYGVVGGKRKLIKATKGKKGALAGVEFGGGKVSVGGAFFKPGYAVGEGGMPSREGVLNLFGGATVTEGFADEHSAIMDWFASHGGDAALDKAYGEWSKGSMSGSFTDYLKSAYKYTPRTSGTINPMSKKYGGMKDKDYNAWMGTGDFYEHTKAYANLYGPSGTITRQQEYLSTVDRNKSYDAGKRRGLNTGYMVSDSGVREYVDESKRVAAEAEANEKLWSIQNQTKATQERVGRGNFTWGMVKGAGEYNAFGELLNRATAKSESISIPSEHRTVTAGRGVTSSREGNVYVTIHVAGNMDSHVSDEMVRKLKRSMFGAGV